ncbi:hypothetical protein BX600DRAFT_511212 [Xylariales sp. PMI_506]|nr:hypothetical protein BX600DRAFT_511212 [Xylariales sp. PMI_506]
MKFTIAISTLFAATSSAIPTASTVDIEPRQLQCLSPQCGYLVQELPCLLYAIEQIGQPGYPAANDIIGCVNGDVLNLCNCLECVPLVGSIVHQLAICA